MPTYRGIYKKDFNFYFKTPIMCKFQCIQLPYSYQVLSHKQILKICWTPKGPNLDQKGPKMGGARFSPDCKPQFFKSRAQYKFLCQQVRLAMVPRNSQLILFKTYIQHQQFLMTKNKISPGIQIYKELKTVFCSI